MKTFLWLMMNYNNWICIYNHHILWFWRYLIYGIPQTRARCEVGSFETEGSLIKYFFYFLESFIHIFKFYFRRIFFLPFSGRLNEKLNYNWQLRDAAKFSSLTVSSTKIFCIQTNKLIKIYFCPRWFIVWAWCDNKGILNGYTRLKECNII